MDKMKILAICELASVPLCVLLGLSLPSSWPQVLGIAHYFLAALAAAAIGHWAWRLRPAAAMAAVVLAAYLGLPNLVTVANLLGTLRSPAPLRAASGYGLFVLLGLLQLIALVIGLRRLAGSES
jgi:hypothetical protein